MPPISVLTPYTFVGAALFNILIGSVLSHQIASETTETGLNVFVLSVLFGGGILLTGDLLGYEIREYGLYILGLLLVLGGLVATVVLILWLGAEFQELLRNSVRELRALIEN